MYHSDKIIEERRSSRTQDISQLASMYTLLIVDDVPIEEITYDLLISTLKEHGHSLDVSNLIDLDSPGYDLLVVSNEQAEKEAGVRYILKENENIIKDGITLGVTVDGAIVTDWHE